MTEDDFKALVTGMPMGWHQIKLSFHEEPAGLYHVTAAIRGDSQKGCLFAAGRILDAVKGKRAFIRIPPEADSQMDFVHDCPLHRGYVRFSFKDEPGEWERSPLEIERTTEHRYLPLGASR